MFEFEKGILYYILLHFITFYYIYIHIIIKIKTFIEIEAKTKLAAVQEDKAIEEIPERAEMLEHLREKFPNIQFTSKWFIINNLIYLKLNLAHEI